MKRNLKALGLALVAVFAMGALMSASASATPVTGHFTTPDAGDYAVDLVTDVYGSNHTFVNTSGSPHFECTEAEFTGGVVNEETNTIEVTPQYAGCTSKVSIFTFPVTVTPNSCKFVFYGTESDVQVACGGSDTIEIHVYSSKANHENKSSLCTLTVGPQTVGSGVQYTNTTNGADPDTVDVIVDAADIHYTRHGSELCGPATGEATYKGNVEVTGFHEGVPVDIDVG